MSKNPYNCNKPGNLFTGYRAELGRILGGLKAGVSFAVIGGRRCGKTSLLLEIQKALGAEVDARRASRPDPNLPALFPRFVDMQAVNPKRRIDFFKSLESAITEGLELRRWKPPESEPPYEVFLARLKEVEGRLQKVHGPRWTVVLLLDELDAAGRSLQDDECFQNLRNLLTVAEPYHSRFRVVCAGSGSLAGLIRHGSPLNILEKKFTRALSAEEAARLVAPGFPGEPPPAVAGEALRLSGGHAYVLQALLSYLWDLRSELPLDPQLARETGRQFVRDRSNELRRWVQDLGPSGRAVYDELLAAGDHTLTKAELRRRFRGRSELSVGDGLHALRFHGLVVDQEDPGRISCELFREWYVSDGVMPMEPARPGEHSGRKRVFVVSGRDARAHQGLCQSLRSFGLEPLEWSDVVALTGDGAPFAGQVLETAFQEVQAVVVLFTPDDLARLAPAHLMPLDPDYEREPTGQPRPNVLIEAGMAMALFPKRTVFVQEGRVRPISDLQGRQIVQMDGSAKACRDLARRLETAGCLVDPHALQEGDAT